MCPFNVPVHTDFLTFVRAKLALPPRSFVLPLLRLFNLKSGFAVAYKQIVALISNFQPSFWENAVAIAASAPRGFMAALLKVRDFATSLSG